MTGQEAGARLRSGIAGVSVGSGFQPAAGLLPGVSPQSRTMPAKSRRVGRRKRLPHTGGKTAGATSGLTGLENVETPMPAKSRRQAESLTPHGRALPGVLIRSDSGGIADEPH